MADTVSTDNQASAVVKAPGINMEPQEIKTGSEDSTEPQAEASAMQIAHPSNSVYGRSVSQFLGVRAMMDSKAFAAYYPVPVLSSESSASSPPLRRWVCCGIFSTAEEAAMARDRAALGLIPLLINSPNSARPQLNYALRRYSALDCFQTVFAIQLRHPDLITMDQVGQAMTNAAAHGAKPPEEEEEDFGMMIASPELDSDHEQQPASRARWRGGRARGDDFVVDDDDEEEDIKRPRRAAMLRQRSGGQQGPAGRRTSPADLGDRGDDPLILLAAAAAADNGPVLGSGMKQRSVEEPKGCSSVKVRLWIPSGCDLHQLNNMGRSIL